MDVTSDEIRSSRFQGTRHVYDRREIDAFLHRAASTLEMYERKLTVAEANVQSLEQALDLAHGRARATENREDRISELEAAFAAAQHNYESALLALESRGDDSDVLAAERLAEAERQAEEILISAHREAGRVKADAERLHLDTEDAANATLAVAQSEAEEILRTALLAQTALLEEVEAQTAAEAAVREEIEGLRASALARSDVAEAGLPGPDAAAAEAELLQVRAELAAAIEERAALAAAAESEVAAVTEQSADSVEAAERAAAEARQRAAEAEQRANAADAERSDLAEQVEDIKREAEAEKVILIAEAQQAVDELVAQLTAERDELVANKTEEMKSEMEAVVAAAAERAAASDAEIESLQRQLAQMRTALANIQQRFANAARVSPEELELAAALVDLDLHDVDQLVDLTAVASAEVADQPVAPEMPDKVGRVAVKSKWSQTESVPRGSWRTAAADKAEPAQGVWPELGDDATWRDTTPEPQRERAKPSNDDDESRGLGFYERRLAGLRERIQDAKADGREPE